MRPQVSPATIDISYLQPVLQRLAQAIGLELTLRLAQACGGVPTYFPRGDLRDDHWLVELLGQEAARKAIEVLGPGESHVLPRGVMALRMARDRQMALDRKTSSVRALARKYGITRRSVQRTFADRLGCGQVDDGQDSLFPSF